MNKEIRSHLNVHQNVVNKDKYIEHYHMKMLCFTHKSI